MPRVVLALDQGTTSSRALVVGADGRVQAVAQREVAPRFPRPGWVEHDADALCASTLGVAAEALARAGVRAADVAAVGLANQRETTVLWDRRTGRPVAPAIVWQDRRTAPACDALREAGHEPDIQSRTGLVLDSYFSATKLAWLLRHTPGARADAHAGHLAFGTVDSWLVWRLTGGTASAGARHVTDVSNASRTLLFNVHTGAWDDDLLALFAVPRSVLPEVVPSSGVVGTVSVGGLPLVPIAGLAGDQHAALFGQRCTRPGLVKNTYGTGCFLLMHTGAAPVASRHGLLTTAAWELAGGPPAYALEGSVFAGGAAVQWLRDGLGLVRTAADVEALAASVPHADGVVFVPAFTGLGAPHWDPYARGTVVGLTRGTTGAHLARAALDGIALQTADVLDAMRADAGLAVPELRVDGGAAANDLLMQIQADVAQTPVVRPRETETTALGAAYLAGLAVGVWDGPDALDALWHAERRFEPAISADEASARRATWSRAVERSKGWAA